MPINYKKTSSFMFFKQFNLMAIFKIKIKSNYEMIGYD